MYLNSSIFSQVYAGKGLKGYHPDGAEKYHRWFYTAITRAKQKLVVNDSPFVVDFAKRHPAENARYWRDIQKAKAAVSKPAIDNYPAGNIEGEVIKILNQNEQGVNGFVRFSGIKDSVYFILSGNNPSSSRIRVGSKVSCTIMAPKNGKNAKVARLRLV